MKTKNKKPLKTTSNFNDEQRAAIESDSDSNLVLAGAGSGKTKTLVGRVKYLIEGLCYQPETIIAITFTNDAAREMERRLMGVKIGFIGTQHSFLFREITKHAKLLGFAAGISVIDREQAEQFLKETMFEMRWGGSLTELQAQLSLGVYAIPRDGTRLTKVQNAAANYFNRLRKANVMDFDSILHHGLKLIEEKEYQIGFEYRAILVDEIQDASPLDFKIYRAMPVWKYFYVGDSDQAIYGFRGGSLSGLMELAQDAHTRVFKLENNYRCDKEICEAAQRLIEKNERLSKKTVSVTGQDGTIEKWLSCVDQEAEVKRIANTIRELGCEKYSAVLLRTNALVEAYSKALEGYGIPIQTKRISKLPEDWRKAMNLLSLLINPYNDTLAAVYLKDQFGEQRAKEICREASNNFISINEHFLKIEDCSIQEAERMMIRNKISRDASDRIADYINNCGPDGTLTDLIFAINSGRGHEQEIGEGVVVITCHAAKGREWDVVFLPAFEEGIIPIKNDAETVEADRRLAFVAMTRARKHLCISYVGARKSQWEYELKPVTPSRFIYDARL